MADLENISVLVIDANAGMRSQLRSMLGSYGISRVQFAVSAGMAVRRLRDGRFDLILCEYHLGDGQDGQHLFEDLRHHEVIPLDTLFVMITGERNYERVISAAELAPNDYILKPLTADTLHSRLVRAFDKREAFLPAYRAMEMGDALAALEYCREAESHFPQYLVDFLRLRAELHAAMGQTDDAEAVYREVRDMRAVPWARLGLAKMLFRKKEYGEAEEILSALVAENERYLDAYDWLARTREETGRLEQAKDVLAAATALSPHRVTRLRRLSEVALTLGDHDTAARTMTEVVRKGKYSDFRDPENHVLLLRAQIGKGDMREAEATIRDLAQSMAGLPKTAACSALSSALYHTKAGDTAKAQEALRTLVDAGTDISDLSTGLKQELVKACFDNELADTGSTVILDILRNASDEATVEATRSVLRERGLDDLSEQLELKIHVEVKALIAAGAEKAQAGDFDGAVHEMMNAVHRTPGNPHVLFNAALALLRHIEHNGWNERFAAQARALIERARRLDPANPRLSAIIGFMHELIRKYKVRSSRPAPPRGNPAA